MWLRKIRLHLFDALIGTAIATVTVIHAIGIWNELILATIYLTDSFRTRYYGLIVFEGVYGSDWPKLAAAVLMLMIPMLALYMFLYIISVSRQAQSPGW